MEIQKLYPVCKDYLWGGTKLKTHYGKQTDLTPCAESWELSFHPDGPTRCSDGRPLSELVGEAELGENAAAFPFFPTLVKLIDAKQDLSFQVHPNDAYALAKEHSYGKSELWYIVEAEEDAGIYLGFSKDISKAEYETAIRENRLNGLMNFYPVRAGEAYVIPSGTVHAIGKGCLICEIQQNSNLTYRVYDYGRLDKNGHARELHVEKALQVTELSKYEHHTLGGDLCGVSKYFHVRKLSVNGPVVQKPIRSFQTVTCVKGSGFIGGMPVACGDSFWIPANFGEYPLDGKMDLILTEIRKYYIGIDLGGTFIKGGIVTDTGELLLHHQIPTESEKGAQQVVSNIASLCHFLMRSLYLTKDDITGIGIGAPGMIDSQNGTVIYSNNLAWEDFAISDALTEQTGLPVKIANDANVAALGEAKFGCGQDFRTVVMLTLGTGVGGGIVINGSLFEGNRSAGAELGHMVISAGGEPCTCGRRGCLEAYASATALIRDTKRAMLADRNSKMWEIGSVDAVNGKTAFAYAETDESAASVVKNYIQMLGCGIVNVANELRPEAIILGGGVCNEGDALTTPLQYILDTESFAGARGPRVNLLTARLGNRAGILGAAALWL